MRDWRASTALIGAANPFRPSKWAKAVHVSQIAYDRAREGGMDTSHMTVRRSLHRDTIRALRGRSNPPATG